MTGVLVVPRSWVGPSTTMQRTKSLELLVTFLHAFYEQIILALGNYMNSSKRGAVYGFKLQSLDLVRWQGQHLQDSIHQC